MEKRERRIEEREKKERLKIFSYLGGHQDVRYDIEVLH